MTAHRRRSPATAANVHSTTTRRSRMNAHRSRRHRARGALATTPLLPELSPTPAPTLPGRRHGFSLPSRQGASRRRQGAPELTTHGTSRTGKLVKQHVLPADATGMRKRIPVAVALAVVAASGTAGAAP